MVEMRSKDEIKKLLNSSGKILEKELGITIRNGQGLTAIKTTLKWVLQMDLPNKINSPVDYLRGVNK
jgi:hypothetical protein